MSDKDLYDIIERAYNFDTSELYQKAEFVVLVRPEDAPRLRAELARLDRRPWHKRLWRFIRGR